MNVLIDSAIFTLQQNGGISRLWRSLLPALRAAMPDATFSPSLAPDWWISTYYKPAPLGVRSLVMVYDLIAQKYPLIDRNRTDAVDLRRAVAEALAVVSISQTTASDVKRLLNRDSVVAYPGVDAGYGKVLPSDVERFQNFVGKPYILVVGNRGLYKNVQALYQAWKLWEGARYHKLLCIGGEDGLPQDAAFVAGNPDTWMHMKLDDTDLQAAYAGATALAYPSLMEGFGLPIIEAMACGCPVVCDTTMSEVAGNAALTCDVTRPRQIAAVLSAALDYEIRLERITAGVERAKRYTWPQMAQTVAETLRRAA